GRCPVRRTYRHHRRADRRAAYRTRAALEATAGRRRRDRPAPRTGGADPAKGQPSGPHRRPGTGGDPRPAVGPAVALAAPRGAQLVYALKLRISIQVSPRSAGALITDREMPHLGRIRSTRQMSMSVRER